MAALVRVNAREVGEGQLDNQALWVSAAIPLICWLDSVAIVRSGLVVMYS